MKKLMSSGTIHLCALGISIGLGSYASLGLSADTPPPTTTTEPDNTGVNKRDVNENELTAQDQGRSDADRQLTQKIRQSITADKDLSTYAHNVKIITRSKTVTLKGPVKSASERNKIIAIAKSIAGDANVKSELAIVR